MMLLFLNLVSYFRRYISEAVLMRITITPSIGLKMRVYAFRKCTRGNYIRSMKATEKKARLSLHLLCFPLIYCNTTEIEMLSWNIVRPTVMKRPVIENSFSASKN